MSSGAGLDVLKAIQGYINKIVTATPGIKVLLLDAETVSSTCSCVCRSIHELTRVHLAQTPILSLASTQSVLLSHEVYLTDRIDNPSRSAPPTASSSSSAYPPSAARSAERLPHLKCICILRPTDESIEACEREIREGRYGGYWLCECIRARVVVSLGGGADPSRNRLHQRALQKPDRAARRSRRA